MTLAFGIGNAQLLEPPREMLSRVVGDDEERRCAGLVVYGERRRLVSRQETIQRVIHQRPVSLANGSSSTWPRSRRWRSLFVQGALSETLAVTPPLRPAWGGAGRTGGRRWTRRCGSSKSRSNHPR